MYYLGAGRRPGVDGRGLDYPHQLVRPNNLHVFLRIQRKALALRRPFLALAFLTFRLRTEDMTPLALQLVVANAGRDFSRECTQAPGVFLPDFQGCPSGLVD